MHLKDSSTFDASTSRGGLPDAAATSTDIAGSIGAHLVCPVQVLLFPSELMVSRIFFKNEFKVSALCLKRTELLPQVTRAIISNKRNASGHY